MLLGEHAYGLGGSSEVIETRPIEAVLELYGDARVDGPGCCVCAASTLFFRLFEGTDVRAPR